MNSAAKGAAKGAGTFPQSFPLPYFSTIYSATFGPPRLTNTLLLTIFIDCRCHDSYLDPSIDSRIWDTRCPGSRLSSVVVPLGVFLVSVCWSSVVPSRIVLPGCCVCVCRCVCHSRLSHGFCGSPAWGLFGFGLLVECCV